MPVAEAASSLEAELTRKLRQRVDAAGADRAQIRATYQALAEDYRTLTLMDELPEHADGAYAAWQQLTPGLADAASRQQLLAVLAAAYSDAAGAAESATADSAKS